MPMTQIFVNVQHNINVPLSLKNVKKEQSLIQLENALASPKMKLMISLLLLKLLEKTVSSELLTMMRMTLVMMIAQLDSLTILNIVDVQLMTTLA